LRNALFVLKVVDFEERAKIKFWIVGKSSVAESCGLTALNSALGFFIVKHQSTSSIFSCASRPAQVTFKNAASITQRLVELGHSMSTLYRFNSLSILLYNPTSRSYRSSKPQIHRDTNPSPRASTAESRYQGYFTSPSESVPQACG
jgi:hypothetical protein